MCEENYDVLVIGAGPGGYTAAIRAAQLGLKVACAERSSTLGGTCTNVGCIPSKAMLHASEIYEQAVTGKFAKFGVRTPGLALDLEAMHAYRKGAIKSLSGGAEYLFVKNKITWLKGQAEFIDRNRVLVGEQTVQARDIILATGSSVSQLPGVLVDQRVVFDSTGALELPRVPQHLVVIGGGVIGLELGSVWRRLGARVTVVESDDQILPGMDGEVRAVAAKIFRKQGLDFKLGSKVVAVTNSGAAADVTITVSGAMETLAADAVLVAIGRKPNTAGLALERAGLATNARGQIEVDPLGRTTTPGVWAIGDVTPGPMLAHRAEDEGVSVAERIAGQTVHEGAAAIPVVVYTNPEIAGVGLTEEQAGAKGKIRIGKFPMLANSRAKTNLEPEGFVKIISDEESDQVLGAWIMASAAGTMIAEVAQLLTLGGTSADIMRTCHAHPTYSEAIKEAATAVRGSAINI